MSTVRWSKDGNSHSLSEGWNIQSVVEGLLPYSGISKMQRSVCLKLEGLVNSEQRLEERIWHRRHMNHRELFIHSAVAQPFGSAVRVYVF